MKKSFIALAVASAFVAPVAMADTTIYGQANASLQYVNNGTNRTENVSSDSSRLGFKGSEDLGGGISAIYQIESDIALDGTAANTTTGQPGSALASRNSYVGLSDAGLGTMLAGRHDTPYKIATRSLDVFADTIADNRNLLGNNPSGYTAFDTTQRNVVAYISPTMSGASVAAAYMALNEAKPTDTAVSLAAMYTEDALNVSLAYESHTIDTLGLKESAVKLGGSYTIMDLTVNGVYEKTSNAGAHKAGYAAARYDLGDGDALKVAYAKGLGASQASVGYDHSMSKRTTVYALYTTLTNKTSNTNSLSFASTGGGFAVAGGTNPKAFALGIKHSF